MKIKVCLCTSILFALHAALGQGTAFTYQGRLNDDGNPAHGSYDFRFKLFEDPDGNAQAGSTILTNGYSLTNGLFTVALDFGPDFFNGSNYWLEVDVRTNGGSGYANLDPLQPVLPTPYAMFANTASNLSGTISSANLSGSYGGSVTFSNAGDTFGGMFSGNGANVTNVNAATLNGLSAASLWKTSGNAGTSPGTNFVGTIDSQPLELRVNSQRVQRFELPSPDGPNLIGGYSNNFVATGISSATIAGGGLAGQTNRILNTGYGGAIGGGRNNAVSSFNGTISGGANNAAIGNAATIGGGSENIAGGDHDWIGGGQFNNTTNGSHAVIAGGLDNTNSGPLATISGGERNLIDYAADHATIGGGFGNTIEGSGGPVSDTIAGGNVNDMQPDVAYGTIGGGTGNVIQSNSVNSTIAGGGNNVIQSGSTNSEIAGGVNNSIQASAFAATVGGGYQNTNSGSYAVLGGGYENLASGIGAFVGGGGHDGYIPAGNQASGPASVVVGGVGNQASGYGAFVGGGGYDGTSTSGNQASSSATVVAGGVGNTASMEHATVGGGYQNTASGYAFGATTVAGGEGNIASGDDATVGGGNGNSAGGALSGSTTVAGGYHNQATAGYATVAGGRQNTASGSWSAVPGGYNNTASGQYSFAAGDSALAQHDGSFVWADSQAATYASDRNNQFKIRAGGGVVMNVSGSSGLNPAALYINSTSGNGVGEYITETSTDAAFVINNTGAGDIMKGFNGGGNPVFEVVHDGTVYSKGFALTSDRNAKENFEKVNSTEILEKIAALSISEWNYKTDRKGVQHVGPTAQDFHAAFGLNGPDDKHISVVDEGGVALAAIQGLNQKIDELKGELTRRDAENAALQRRLDKLERLLVDTEREVPEKRGK